MTCVFDDITSVELGGTAFPPNPITANGIRIGLDSGSLVFVLIYDATGTRALTHSGGPAITTGLHTIRAWSTDGVTSNIQIDNDTPDTATFDHTPSNSNTATVDYVLGATAGGGAYHLSHISVDGFFEYSGASSYGTTAPDLSGNGNDGVLTDADIVYYPALADGTDDVAGLGIRNKGGYIHNNGSFDIQQDSGDATLLENPFWSADSVNYDAKTFADLVAHPSFQDNVLIKWAVNEGYCYVEEVLTWPSSYIWTPETYEAMSAYLGDADCGAGELTPLVDGNGGYILDGDGYIIFAMP